MEKEDYQTGMQTGGIAKSQHLVVSTVEKEIQKTRCFAEMSILKHVRERID